MALLDPLMLIIHSFIEVDPFRIYAIFLMVAIFSIQRLSWIKKNLIFIIPIIIVNALFSWYIEVTYITLYLIVLNLIIFIIFLSKAIFEVYKEDIINIFYFVICVYEISVIMKYILFITDVKTGVIFFYLTSAFEILIGIYFILYNEKNSPKIKLNMSAQKN